MHSTRKKIQTMLESHFPDMGQEHFSELLADYVDSGLPQENFLSELNTGEQRKLWSSVWEAMLYRHLRRLGFKFVDFTTKKQPQGPDFCVEYGGKKIWIEAITPTPEGIPDEWLEPVPPGEFRVRRKPDQQRVLRCTQAIRDKHIKFIQYREHGIIGANDCVVIAVNICQLSDWDVDGNGVSQFPLVMEALFPVGPLGIQLSRDGESDGAARNLQRSVLQKSNGETVEPTYFLKGEFANVSAVMQAHQRDMFEKPLALSMVHNPLASNALPINLFRSHKEFIAVDRGEEIEIMNVASHSSGL